MSSVVNKKNIDKLLTRISEGDNNAFERLYECTKRGVFSLIYSIVNNYHDAEDLMQTVYLKIKLNIDTYHSGSNGGAWILQIAKNLAINHIRKNSKTVFSEDIEGENANTNENSSTDSYPLEISDFMNRALTEEEREIVTLHVLFNYKHREIAEMYNCPTGTITSKYKRALSKLKQELKGKQV